MVIGSTINPYRFGGQLGYRRDAPNRLYIRQRHLNTAQGRWISRDPIVDGSFNFYWYSKNNPPVYRDPSGLYAIINCKEKAFYQAAFDLACRMGSHCHTLSGYTQRCIQERCNPKPAYYDPGTSKPTLIITCGSPSCSKPGGNCAESFAGWITLCTNRITDQAQCNSCNGSSPVNVGNSKLTVAAQTILHEMLHGCTYLDMRLCPNSLSYPNPADEDSCKCFGYAGTNLRAYPPSL